MILLQLASFLILQLGALGILAASAWIFGRTALARAGLGGADATPPIALALGIGLISQGAFLLGLLGGFKAQVIFGSMAIGHWLCRRTWATSLPRWRRLPGLLGPHLPWLIPILWLGLYPPLGWDATAYHLPYVRSFLEAGRPVFVEHLRYPVFPQAAEVFFLIASMLGGDVAAKLTQTLALLVTAGLLVEWGRRFFSPRAGYWAAALWLGTPLAVWLGTLAFVDVQLTLFVVAGVFSWQRWRAEPTPQLRSRWLVLAGFFAGMAAGTKYLGLFFCLALGVMTLARSWRRRSPRPAIILTLAAVFALGPWYARILWHTGNPVFPFYAPLFGASEWTTRHDRIVFGEKPRAARDPAEDPADYPADHGGVPQLDRLIDGLGLLARLPWSGVFERREFFSVAPLTPWYLLLLPLALPILLLTRGDPRRRKARGLAILVGVYSLFWLTIEHDLRFLLPAMPLLDLALAAALDQVSPRLRRPLPARLVTAVLIAPGLLYAGFKIWQLGPLPTSAGARDDFLEAEVPGYGGIRWLNERYGSDYTVYGLYAGRLRHYAEGRLLGDVWGPLAYRRLIGASTDSRSLALELDQIGACHLLVHRRWLTRRLRRDPELLETFDIVWQQPPFYLFSHCDPPRDPPGDQSR